jgi:DNA-binding helix-hairpin-helix protein with protein kinase domain
MLEGIRSNPIVVGAYTDDQGGICPMLAAHRNGGRTTYLAFARSWDRFARARGVRRATRRELAVLEAQLTASLLGSEDVDLRAAIADHEALKQRRDQTFPEITARRLRPRRKDAEGALARLEQELARI